jgi:hypothetical protein
MTANNFSGSSLLWNAEGISAGTYIVRAKIDGKTISAKALLSR